MNGTDLKYGCIHVCLLLYNTIPDVIALFRFYNTKRLIVIIDYFNIQYTQIVMIMIVEVKQ